MVQEVIVPGSVVDSNFYGTDWGAVLYGINAWSAGGGYSWGGGTMAAPPALPPPIAAGGGAAPGGGLTEIVVRGKRPSRSRSASSLTLQMPWLAASPLAATLAGAKPAPVPVPRPSRQPPRRRPPARPPARPRRPPRVPKKIPWWTRPPLWGPGVKPDTTGRGSGTTRPSSPSGAPRGGGSGGVLGRLATALGRGLGILGGLLFPSPLAGPELDEPAYPGYLGPVLSGPAIGPLGLPAPDGGIDEVVVYSSPGSRPAGEPSAFANPLGLVVPGQFPLELPGISPGTVPLPASVPVPAPQPRPVPVTQPLAIPSPLIWADPFPLMDPTRTPAPLPAPSPLTLAQPMPVPFPQPQPQPQSEACKECARQRKKDRKKRKDRTECYRGTYRDLRKGLSKHKLEKIPCQ